MSNESPSLVSRFLRSVQPEGSTPAAPKTEKELDDLLENRLKDASPEEATSIRNAAKMLRKADKYGPVQVTARDNTTASRAYRNRRKHDKYNFLSGMLLSKSGLAKSDPQLAGLAKMFLNNPAKYGKNPEKLLFDAVTRPKHRRGRHGRNRRRGGGARGRGRGRTRGRGRVRGRGGGRGRGRGGGQRAAVPSKQSNPAALSAGPSSSHAPGQSSQQQQQLNVDSGASAQSSGFRRSFRNNFAKALNFGATALQKKKKPKVREGLSDEPTFARPPAFRPGSKQVVNHVEGNTLTPDQSYSSSLGEFNDYSSSSSEDEIEHGEGEHSGQDDDEHHEGYDDVHDDEYDERPHDEYEQDFEDEHDGDYCEDEEHGLEEALAGTSLNDSNDSHHDEEYNDDEDYEDVEEEENDCEEAEQQDEYEQDFEDEHDGNYCEDEEHGLEEALAGTSLNDDNDGHHDEEYNDDEDYGDAEEEEHNCEEAEQELMNEMERDEEVSKQEYEEQVGQAEHDYSHDVLEQVQAIGNIILEEHAADEECEHDEETVVHDYLHDIREEEHATTEYSFQHEDGGDNSYQIEHDQNEYAHDCEEAVDDYGHDGADFECGDYYGGDDYEE